MIYTVTLALFFMTTSCVPSGGIPDDPLENLALDINEQEIPEGGFLTYVLQSNDIIGMPNEHIATIKITSDDGSGIFFDGSVFSSSQPLTKEGVYTIEGTITVGEKVTPWKFNITVKHSSQLLLSIPVQNMTRYRNFYYPIKDASIFNLQKENGFSIDILDDDGSGIVFDKKRRAFKGVHLLPEIYTIKGTISDGHTKSHWSFILNSTFYPGPILNFNNHMLEAGSFFIYNLNAGEIMDNLTHELTRSTLNSNDGSEITLDDNHLLISTMPLNQTGYYTLTGNVFFKTKISPWNFTLIVMDTTAPKLVIDDQIIGSEQNFSYSIDQNTDISDLRNNEDYILSITNDDESGLTYDRYEKSFQQKSMAKGEYTITGVISDGQNTSQWSFRLTVL